MNLRKIIALLPLLLGGITTVHAQQGFGTNTPDASAVVDMTAANKGVLLPRVALTSTNSASPVSSPAANLLVFNTATAGISPTNVTPGLYFWNGTAWVRLLYYGESLSTAWVSTGNAGTTPTSNFVGTTDSKGIVFNTNATEHMRIGNGGVVRVGDNTNPISSALLNVNSSTLGFLPPRMTAVQMAAIANPVEGLTVYNTTLQCLAYYSKGAFTCATVTPGTQTGVGSSFTGFYNGWVAGAYTGTSTTITHTQGEAFSTNTYCANAIISAGGCGGASTVTGSSGIVYPLVEINGQCWTAENMREVPSNYSSYTATSWLHTTPGDLGYWGYYNTTDATGASGWGTTEPTNVNGHYGLLYQWSAAMNGATVERSRGICPVGFHIPSDCEWMYLEHGLGMKVSEQNTIGWRAQTSTEAVGYKLTKDGGYNNASGFSILYASERNTTGNFELSLNSVSYLWSSVGNIYVGNIRAFGSGSRGSLRQNYSPDYGESVRCLKDDNWSCGSPLTVSHVAGSVAPTTTTISYGTVNSSLSGTSKCWITQNLGATRQATSATDATDAAAGWYWQFNRQQGYAMNGSTRTPNTAWIGSSSINENSAWTAANDPCTLLLGPAWSMPTQSEWANVISNGSWASGSAAAYASLLKMHDAGYLNGNSALLLVRGSGGWYWSSSQVNNTVGYMLTITSGSTVITNLYEKTNGLTMRCHRYY